MTNTFRNIGSSASTKPDLDLSKNVGLEVGDGSFNSCYFNNMIFPNNCTLISGACKYCSASTLSFGTGTIISDVGQIYSTFYLCNISNIDLNGVTKIGIKAFDRLSGCNSITIPPSVTDFDSYAFSGSSSLNSVTIDYASNATFGYAQFAGLPITSLTIGSNPTRIPSTMFSGCTKLTSLDIPSNISSIGSGAFESCTGLTSLVIPSNVLSIDNKAFSKCSGLTSVTVESTTPPKLGSYVFNYTSCPIYVPPESVDAYKAASKWSNYASRIQAIPT